MFIKDIVVDLDDTAFATYPYFDQELKSRGVDCQGQYFTAHNGGPHFLEMLSDASFMLHVPLRPFVANTLDLLRARGHVVHVCTHRGYTDKGLQYTVKSLEKNNLQGLISRLHVIDPYKISDKLEYLNKAFGHNNFILVDDKPIFDKAKPLPNNVLLQNQFWNSHIPHPYRIDTFERDEFFGVLEQMQHDLSAINS